jgi:hypothetical protein
MRWIAILGGRLIMMGQHDRSESLFYYFRIEDQVPENHLLHSASRWVWWRASRCRPHGDSRRQRFQVLLPQLPEDRACSLIAESGSISECQAPKELILRTPL